MNAGERDAACVARELDGLRCRLRSGGAVDGAIDAALRRWRAGSRRRFLRLERCVGAHGARQFAAMRQRFDGPDAACFRGAQCGNGQQADRSCADDRNSFARADGREAQGVHGDGERLGESGCVERQVCGDGREVRGGQVDHSRKKPG